MTDPDNIQEVSFVGEKLSIKNITALCFFNGSLWIAQYQNEFSRTERNIICIADRTEHNFRTRFSLPISFKDHFITDFHAIPYPEAMLVHYKCINDTSLNPVEIIYPTGLRTLISRNANFVLTNFPPPNLPELSSMANTDQKDPPNIIALITDNNIYFYTFLGNLLVFNPNCVYAAPGPITAADMTKKFLIFSCNNKYFRVDFWNDWDSAGKKNPIPLQDSSVTHAIVKTISPTSIVILYSESMIIISEEKSESIPYSQGRKNPIFLYGNESFMYQVFYDCILGGDIRKSPITFGRPDAKILCSVGQDLLVKTEDKLYMIGTLPHSMKLVEQIRGGREDEVQELLEKQPLESRSSAMYELFKLLWKHRDYASALRLITKNT